MKPIVLTLRTATGKTMKPEVQTSDTIAMVKAKIAEGWKLPHEQEIRLCLKNHRILEDEHTLTHYQIEKDTYVCVILAPISKNPHV
jgi:hypothetical protein